MAIIKKNKKRTSEWLLCNFKEIHCTEQEIKQNQELKKIKCRRCGQIRYVKQDCDYTTPFVYMVVCGRDKIKAERNKKLREKKEKQSKLYQDFKKDTEDKMPDATEELSKDIVSMGKRYVGARKKWVESGKPMRDEETVTYIYDKICGNCEHFTGKSCKICGCRISSTGAMLNKLAWLTEQCPADPPKWLEGENKTDILHRKIVEELDKNNDTPI